MEEEYAVWLSKVCKLSVELSLSVDCFCDESTKHIEHALLIMKSRLTLNSIPQKSGRTEKIKRKNHA
ncbi:hypothetical protein CS542_02935 [Pedobacter sp. IW39]|nr:hypothetical protein CS542_02935 [Pedobacter sp. IW39]